MLAAARCPKICSFQLSRRAVAAAVGLAAGWRRGSRMMSNTQMASLTQQPRTRVPEGAWPVGKQSRRKNARTFAQADRMESPPMPASFARPAVTPAEDSNDYSSVSRPVSDGWYAQRRDQSANGAGHAGGRISRGATQRTERSSWWVRCFNRAKCFVPAAPSTAGRVETCPRRSVIQAQPLVKPASTSSSNGRVLMEWNRPADQPYQPAKEISGVAANDSGKLLR